MSDQPTPATPAPRKMGLTLPEFMATPFPPMPIGTCEICEKPVFGTQGDDRRTRDGGPVHEDCYFRKLGEIVEAHPPGIPRRSPITP